MVLGQFPHWDANCLFHWHISCIKIAVLHQYYALSDALVKPSPLSFSSNSHYDVPLWDNLIKVLCPSLKVKSTMDESLLFSLSWDSFTYNVEKSYVAIDLGGFSYLCYLMTKWWGQNFVRHKPCFNLIRI